MAKNRARQAAARRNPWVKYIGSKCAPRYHKRKERKQRVQSKKRQRMLRQMVEKPRKRRRIVVDDEPGLVGASRRSARIPKPKRDASFAYN